MTFDGPSLASLAMFLLVALQDPEKAAIKLLEDFESSDAKDSGKIKEFVCTKFKCENVTTEVQENKLIFVLHQTEETGEGIIQFMLKLLGMFKFIMTEEQIAKIKSSMLETEFAYYEIEKKLDIEIEVVNEKILEKLREMMEKKGELKNE